MSLSWTKALVLLSLTDRNYVNKMEIILNDSSKFSKIGPVNSRETTVKIDSRVQRRSLSVYKRKLLSKMVYDRIRSAASQRIGCLWFTRRVPPLDHFVHGGVPSK